LKRKWRTDVTDAGTGLDTGGVLAGWQKIVAARGEEPWEVTKAKIFAFGCDRTAIGVSPHDWFPAFAPWSFHRGHPLWKILPRRANEVDARRSPGLAKKIAAGTKDGSWVVWKDYSHCAPDWDDILALGFPGMRDRLLANWKDAPYYHARRIAADATIRLVGRLALLLSFIIYVGMECEDVFGGREVGHIRIQVVADINGGVGVGRPLGGLDCSA
jgi:hypothetical protein